MAPKHLKITLQQPKILVQLLFSIMSLIMLVSEQVVYHIRKLKFAAYNQHGSTNQTLRNNSGGERVDMQLGRLPGGL